MVGARRRSLAHTVARCPRGHAARRYCIPQIADSNTARSDAHCAMDVSITQVREPGLQAPVRMVRRLAAVAFADVAGWSSLVEANELEAVRAWTALRTGFIEPKIAEHAGRLVDLAGDAVFVEFASAVEAVGWALALQRRPADRAARPGGLQLSLRIGINVCDVLVDEGRLVGDGVNIASRIHQAAAPGDIVVTESVRQHVQQRIAVAFRDIGERQLKNISRPIRVYRVEAAGLTARESLDHGAVERATRALLALDFAPPRATPAQAVDGAAWRRLKDHVAQELVPSCGGRVVRHHDSGFLLDFAAAQPAVRAAFQIQTACANRLAGQSLQPGILPRMALQIGEVPADGTDAPSAGASVALRLIDIAAPGGSVVSSTVRDQLTSALDAEIEDLGECYLPAMNQPVRAYRLEPPGSRPALEPAGTPDQLRSTIAIIPFSERGTGHEPLGEILAEELISALSRSAELNVVSRLSTTAFRGRGASLGELSTHLKADYALCGAYRVVAGSLVLSAELAETKTGRVAWAKDFKGSVAGLIEGKGDLVDRLVAEVSSGVMARELERTRSQSLQSLETCTLLIGAIALMHRLSPVDFHRARDMLQAVVHRVPRHPVPLAWLAKWHVLRVWQSWSDDPVADARIALDCGKRALDNDSQCSLALAIDGFAHTNLLKALDVGQQRYDMALQVNPNDSLAWLLSGTLHAFKGEGKQAVKAARHALRLSPLDLHHYFYDSLGASAELSAGRYERAIELARRSLRANRMHASTYRVLTVALWQNGQHDDAHAAVGELMKIEPMLTVSNWLERSPSSAYPVGKLCADAMRSAGVPA